MQGDGSIPGVYLGSSSPEALLLKLDGNGVLQAAHLLGGPKGEGFGGSFQQPGGFCSAVPTTDGSYALTIDTYSYITGVAAKPDWWVVKATPNGRVTNFLDVMGDEPLSAFAEADNTVASMATSNFSGTPPNYLSVNPTQSPNFIIENLAANTGINLPNVMIQAASAQLPLLPQTGALAASVPVTVQLGVGGVIPAGSPFLFATTQSSTATGLFLRVQSSTTPLIESSWEDLAPAPGAMSAGGAFMTLDPDGRWTLATFDVPGVDPTTGANIYFRAISALKGFADSPSTFTGTADSNGDPTYMGFPIAAGGAPGFFGGSISLGEAFEYSPFFGYYNVYFYPYIYHTTLGYLYFLDAMNAAGGAYLYDFGTSKGSLSFVYTSPALYPYLYDFGLGTFLFYFEGTSNPRVFARLDNGQFLFY